MTLSNQPLDGQSPSAVKERIGAVLSRFDSDRSSLISLLQGVQSELGYLPEEAFVQVARHLGVSSSEVYGVATFYAQFRLHPSARYDVRVCSGTACHVRGGQRILETASRCLSLMPGETSGDLKYSLETVPCFGSCSLGPVMVVNDTVCGRLTVDKTKHILENLN
ncbi:MAG: NAD(P)H-dependent oxidoreductase subunit E [Chloroflexota bacterium]